MVALTTGPAIAEPLEQCDPAKVLTAGTCAKCHAPETEVWKSTPHFRTFETLHRSSQAKEIAAKMGVSSIKRAELCTQCHYTQQLDGDKLKTVSGISCESCHGAARDWISLHNDYGGSGVTKQLETAEHREARLRHSLSAGMRNPTNLYLVARSCLGCHTVPHEKLVNVGGHTAGSADFNLVAWSQGKVKHNFLTNGGKNATSPQDRLRVMFLVGLVADLEFSTRATADATQKAKYGVTVATRAVKAAVTLQEIQRDLQHPLLTEVLAAFAEAELRTHNRAALDAIADRIRRAGTQLGDQLDGATLSILDPRLPPPNTYK